MSPDGASLIYSTYLGQGSEGHGIAVDAAGSAYLTGQTYGGAAFPTTPGVVQNAPGETAGNNSFVAKLNPSDSALIYSTYLGGKLGGHDSANGIAVDARGSAYITGTTASTRFPVAHALQPRWPGGPAGTDHPFVSKLNSTGTALIYSTYLGGSESDGANAIAIDQAGDACVTGTTVSTDFPLQRPLQSVQAGFGNAFVSELAPDGSALVYSTYLGGNQS